MKLLKYIFQNPLEFSLCIILVSLVNFILQFISSGGGVAYAAHIGGFISGIILILFFNKKKIIKNKIINGPWE